MRLGDIVPAIAVLCLAGIFGGIALKVMDSLSLTGDGALFLGNATEGLTNLASNFSLIGTDRAVAA
jgi:hypothetical protein